MALRSLLLMVLGMLAGPAFADSDIVTANRVYHHADGRKFQVVYGSRVLPAHTTENSLFRHNLPDADPRPILAQTQEALDSWLAGYANDGFLVPGQDDKSIAQYRSRSGLDKHNDFILVYELTGPSFQGRELIGFWGVGDVETMKRVFGICLHERRVCMAQLAPTFFPLHWRAEPSRWAGVQSFLIWDGGQALEIGPVWAAHGHPWVFSHMLHSAHWDAGITTTQAAASGFLRPHIWGPALVLPSDFVNWSAPRSGGRYSRARLFRERLHHSPLLIEGSSTAVWNDKVVELSTIHITTYLHDLAAQLRHEAFVEFLRRATAGPLHLGLEPWTHPPSESDWSHRDVIRTAIDGPGGNFCGPQLALMNSATLIESLHAGPGAKVYRLLETQLDDRGRPVFRPLHGTWKRDR